MPTSDDSDSLKKSVHIAMQCAAALKELSSVYERLQAEIDRRKPVCVASGKCCHFESYGHRLYVTTLELAAFVMQLQLAPLGSRAKNAERSNSCESSIERNSLSLSLLPTPRAQSDGCLFQIEQLCSVHAIRPFGCRIFFCDLSASDWQQQQYELFHSEIQKLHERFALPYRYVEWRSALDALQDELP